MNFLLMSQEYCPSYTLGHARLPRHENMHLVCVDASLPKNMGIRHGTARNLHTIVLLPMQLRLQKLTARNITDVRKVQLVMRTVSPGVKTPKTVIRSGHCQIPKLHQDDVMS